MNELAIGAREFSKAYLSRLEKVLQRMDVLGVDALVLSLGADLPWLTGYQAMPLERLTALVIRHNEEPVMVVPALEAPRVSQQGHLFRVRKWQEYEDPYDIVAGAIEGCGRIGISDRTWAVSLLNLQSRSKATFLSASLVTKDLRSVKDSVERAMLAEAARRTDRIAQSVISGEVRFTGRSEREISMEISERLIAAGLAKVNFSIVGSGPNSSSPHHEPGKRIVGRCEAIVCDFGGEFRLEESAGYCSDITRTVATGEMPDRFVELYSVLQVAQRRQLDNVREGISCERLDEIGRSYIGEFGYDEYFIHRTGHGIGIEEHEEPYIVIGNSDSIEAGNAFSIEPGIYIPNLYGARIEDIVIATESGCEVLNNVDRSLHQVE
ncbi:MAG: aminopeptidase P family protein [Acidimicrobiaceae bacterium]|nr:aminopeptidase P family protein [Acidimicrobiaceae bacterium]